jgi:DNA-binding transcriptional MerR regulator
MAYKIKDLTVQLAKRPGIHRPFNTCSGCARSNIIPVLSELCFGPGLTQVTLWQILTPVTLAFRASSDEDSLAALSTLKEQLKQQLSEVEREQAALEKSMAPQTIEEVDMLTDKLNDALKELKARRVELAKKPKAARTK